MLRAVGMTRDPSRALLAGLVFLAGLAGCTPGSNRHMRFGEPLEVNQGVCIVNTHYEQDGEVLNWDDTTRKLSHNPAAAPHMSAGNAWAIGSIVAAVTSTPAVIVGGYGTRGEIDMDEDLAQGLFVGGLIVAGVGLTMCIISDAEYAAGGRAYNEYLRTTGRGDPNDERAYEDAESTK
jgi:hypothetical protein